MGPNSPTPTHASLAAFRAPVAEWFATALGASTRAQELAWPAIASGEHTLLLAPTGSGKTLSAFLTAIDHVMFEPPPPPSERCRVLYISPLKALAVDIERNLERPIEGIADIAIRARQPFHMPEIAVRTGDTPSKERRRFARKPADIFITTPESLFLVLTSAARETLRTVRWVIVDEIHAVVGTKRGAHLALSLERLEELVCGSRGEAGGACRLQRIGLSATQRPLDEVARFLGGFGSDGRPRPVVIADAGSHKRLDLRVELAVADLRAAQARPRPVLERVGSHQVRLPKAAAEKGPEADVSHERGLWPAVHPMILDLIRSHRSTLIFVNNRRLAERMAASLNELARAEIVQAHHGSIAREQRLQIEEALKSGRLPALVATSSLELGIDMGAIDLVIQVEAPPSVSAAMQRIGRAGHHVDTPSKGIIIPKHRADLLACATVAERMHSGAVEAMRYPRNPLDVLAQQIVAMVSMDDWTVDRLEEVVRRSAPFERLPRTLFEDVLDMLSGKYPSHDFADLRPRLTWDRASGELRARDGARRTAIGNAGTIPDRGLYGVFLAGAPPGQGRVGELEEVMVFESRVGDVFLLGASSWRFMEIGHDRVTVAPAAGVPGRMPFWHGENIGRPMELGRAMGALTRSLRELPEQDAVEMLVRKHDLSHAAATDLLGYLRDQYDASGAVPDDRNIVVERHRDEMGEWRVCILTPFGSRVHAPWAMAIGAMLRDRTGLETDALWTDNGIVLRFPDREAPPPTEWLIPPADDVERTVVRQLAVGGGAARHVSQGAPVTTVFASRFREAAARALLLPHRKPGKRSPLWQTRKRAADLLHVVARYPDFPIVLETYRECLQDVFDIPGLVELMRGVEEGSVQVRTVDTLVPSPFASSLLFSYVANFMYEGDAPMAERRAQALMIDSARLRQILGDVDMRDLLSPEALAEMEEQLQCLDAGARVRSADHLHDLLLRLGDLSMEEVSQRAASRDDAALRLEELRAAGRILLVQIAGEQRWIAIEDAARYRDALGVALPDGVPQPYLEPVREPLADLLGRYARRRGPFRLEDAAQRFGIGVAPLGTVAAELESRGRLVQGEFRPGGVGAEWVDAEVLRGLRGRSLARLRAEVEPVGQTALARFAMQWHELAFPSSRPRRTASLVEVIRRLQGASVPASILEKDILEARIPGYDPRDLDMLLASGEVLWVGDGRLGARDGRVRLLFSAEASELVKRPQSDADYGAVDGVAASVLEFLGSSGASFFPAIARAVGGFPPEALEALWDLVWAGLVTNDTMQPLRHLVDTRASQRAQEYARRHVGRYRPLSTSATMGGRPVQPTAGGRWSLVSSLVAQQGVSTDRAVAWARQLLERHGVLTREAVISEGIEGGFTPIYSVLKRLEETGRIRRGYFVEGLGATQFALPEAVEQLRECRSDEPPPNGPDGADSQAARVLAAADPANLYGAGLPWPQRDGPRRPARQPGAYVAIVGGVLAAWLAPAEERMLLFAETDAVIADAARAIAEACASGRLGPMVIRRLDDEPAATHPAAGVLRANGFASDSRGLLLRRPSLR